MAQKLVIQDGQRRTTAIKSILPVAGLLVCPFDVGQTYSRKAIYEILNVPYDKQRGNWETGYNRWGDDLFIFSTVGSPATGGFDYENRWEGDVFVWYAKKWTTLDQPQIKWVLSPPGRVYIFTRPAVRHDFTFEGIGTALSHEDSTPVVIRWKIDRLGTRPDSLGSVSDTGVQPSINQFNLKAFAELLNDKSHSHPIGALQQIRAELHGKRYTGDNIFSSQTIFDDYAFHFGGRTELQYNIGFDGNEGKMLRYGIAFSFETNLTLPSIDPLAPKLRLFNEFIRLNADSLSDLRIWHWQNHQRSSESLPGPIPEDLFANGVFLFLGCIQPVDSVDADTVLTVMDRLLPLYKYVESDGKSQPVPIPNPKKFVFRPGCNTTMASTTATYAQREINVDLRHRKLVIELHRQLAEKYGEENAGTEIETGIGTKIDATVKQPPGFSYYEIKTYHSPRACVREAIGQLLEYSFWPGCAEACEFIVVGEGPPDDDVKEYCRRLNEKFSLPIRYEQIKCD